MFNPPDPTLVDRIRFFFTRSISKILGIISIRQKQIVVCGFPRSGTSLMYNMLSSTLLGGFKFVEFEAYFMREIHKLGNIATKAPLDVCHLSHINRLNIHNKDLIVVIMIRDLREVITSVHPVCNGDYFIGFDHSYWPQDEEYENWRYDAPGVIEINECISKAEIYCDPIIIKYEDLVSDPDTVQSRLSAKYDLSFRLKFSEYHKVPAKHAYRYTGKRSPKDASLTLEGDPVVRKQKRWLLEKHKNRIISQFTSCPELFDILIKLGYERDNSWFAGLGRTDN